MEKNTEKKIAVVSFEAGSAELLSNYLKKKKINNYIFFLNSTTKKIFIKNKIKIFNIKSSIKHFTNVKKIIFGASYDNKEIKLIDKIKKKKFKTECFLDHWFFYRKRLSLKKKIYSPDKIYVFNKHALREIKKISFKNTKIILKKNPILNKIKNKNLKIKFKKKKSVIFLNNVLLNNERSKEYLSNSLLIKNSLKILRSINSDKKYYIKLHPSNNQKIYEKFIKKFKELVVIKENKLENILSKSNLIITNNSSVLFFAHIMGIKNINIIKNDSNIIPKNYSDKVINIKDLKST